MKISFIDTIGRFITISFGMLMALSFYSHLFIEGYVFGIIFIIACLIDTSKDEKELSK